MKIHKQMTCVSRQTVFSRCFVLLGLFESTIPWYCVALGIAYHGTPCSGVEYHSAFYSSTALPLTGAFCDRQRNALRVHSHIHDVMVIISATCLPAPYVCGIVSSFSCLLFLNSLRLAEPLPRTCVKANNKCLNWGDYFRLSCAFTFSSPIASLMAGMKNTILLIIDFQAFVPFFQSESMWCAYNSGTNICVVFPACQLHHPDVIAPYTIIE